MSAVSVQAPLPQYRDAFAYWDEFTLQCRRHVKAINAVLREHQVPEERGVIWKPGVLSVAMIRRQHPSTEVKLALAFEQWGPKICVSVRGEEEADLRFYPEEFEFLLVEDQEGRSVAVNSEGLGLSPHEFAKYVAQNFRRCYPGLSLPCPEEPLD